jgi:hypothetical protein
VTQKDGYFKLDLSPYAIYLQHDVLLSLELIAYNGSPGSYINLSCALGGPSFYRKTSHDDWTHVPMIRIGAFLDVDYEKQ